MDIQVVAGAKNKRRLSFKNYFKRKLGKFNEGIC